MTMNKKSMLIIDGNNLAHRAQHKFNLSTAEGKPSSVVYGFVYVLNSLIKRMSPNQVVVAFDGGSHPERLKILPGYKARDHRMEEDEYKAFTDQIAFLRENLKFAGVTVVHERFMEADDLIYMVVRSNPNSYKTIVSSDKDFNQLLGPNTKIYNPFRESYITHLNCKQEFGYEAKQCVDYLCLDGDKSDKIPGVPGMGPVRIAQFLEEFGSVEDYLESDDQGKWVKYPIEEVWKRNRKVISLSLFHTKFLKLKPLRGYPASFNPKEAHLAFFREYQVRIFQNPEVIETFKRLV